MIPNHLALIPYNVHQFAATQAIIDVERKQLRGITLSQFPYARALFRHLRGGAMRITAKDIRFAVGDYAPKERGGASKTDYIAALDRLIETRGWSCPLPLSDSTVGQYFPEEQYRLSERKNRQWELRFTSVDKIEAVYAWSQRFSRIRSDVFASGQPLWAALKGMHDVLASRTTLEQWLDTLALPNKGAHKC